MEGGILQAQAPHNEVSVASARLPLNAGSSGARESR